DADHTSIRLLPTRRSSDLVRMFVLLCPTNETRSSKDEIHVHCSSNDSGVGRYCAGFRRRRQESWRYGRPHRRLRQQQHATRPVRSEETRLNSSHVKTSYAV